MTSNVGSDRITGPMVDERIREAIEEVLETTFKPEFLNRIDEVVIFHRLSREDIAKIVDLQVEQLSTRVRERGIEIELADDARTLLGNLGYDPTYGARPLKRVIQRQLVDKLALKLLEGEFAAGDVIRAEAADGELVLERAGAAAATAAQGRSAQAPALRSALGRSLRCARCGSGSAPTGSTAGRESSPASCARASTRSDTRRSCRTADEGEQRPAGVRGSDRGLGPAA